MEPSSPSDTRRRNHYLPCSYLSGLASKDATQFKFSFALWTRAIVAEVIRRHLGVKRSITSVGRLLAQLGLTCQKPLYRAYQQDPVSVEKWLKQEYPRIRALAGKTKAGIYFEDEAGIRSDFHAGTTWGVRGNTPVVRTTGARFGSNMISAVSPRGLRRFMVVSGNVTTLTTCDLIDRLMKGTSQRIFLILDGHPAHRDKKVRDHIESYGGNLRVFLLPAYAPELNPGENVWNEVKARGVRRMPVTGFDHLKTHVIGCLRHLRKSPATIRAFLQARSTRYAA